MRLLRRQHTYLPAVTSLLEVPRRPAQGDRNLPTLNFIRRNLNRERRSGLCPQVEAGDRSSSVLLFPTVGPVSPRDLCNRVHSPEPEIHLDHRT
jgi:hypothetical protein